MRHTSGVHSSCSCLSRKLSTLFEELKRPARQNLHMHTAASHGVIENSRFSTETEPANTHTEEAKSQAQKRGLTCKCAGSKQWVYTICMPQSNFSNTSMDTTLALARRTRLVATHSPCIDDIFRRTKSHRDHMLLTQHLNGKSPPACKQQLKRSADHKLLLNISAHTVTAESAVCLHVSM